MAEDYYGGDEAEAGAGKGMEGGGERSDMGKGMGAGETTLVPKSMFGGNEPAPGQEFYFKVVHVYENEVEVSYSKGEEKPKETAGDMDTPEKAFDSKFSMME